MARNLAWDIGPTWPAVAPPFEGIDVPRCVPTRARISRIPVMTDEPTRRIATTFDVMAPTYEVLRFVRRAAERLVEVADLPPGGRVLDVATGTGHAAIAAAARLGPSGSVLGIDISEGMLEIARGAIEPLGLPIEVRVGDVQALDLPDASFDAVICASGIFFVPDLEAAARECRRVLVPGGQLAFTAFGASMLQGLRERFTATLARHGHPPTPAPAMRLQEPEACRRLLEGAGFVDVEVWTEQLGYHLPDAGGALARDRGLAGGPSARRRARRRRRPRAGGAPRGAGRARRPGRHLGRRRDELRDGPRAVNDAERSCATPTRRSTRATSPVPSPACNRTSTGRTSGRAAAPWATTRCATTGRASGPRSTRRRSRSSSASCLTAACAVDVLIVVRDRDGRRIGEQHVVHVFTLEDGLVARMDVADPGRPAPTIELGG